MTSPLGVTEGLALPLLSKLFAWDAEAALVHVELKHKSRCQLKPQLPACQLRKHHQQLDKPYIATTTGHFTIAH
jgi:hypothetical protein